MNALERLDDTTVHLESAVDSMKELPERFEPLGFHAGQGSRDVGEEGHTSASCILDPCNSNVEKLTWLFGTTPVS
jgi:virulence-associated protein VapD